MVHLLLTLIMDSHLEQGDIHRMVVDHPWDQGICGHNNKDILHIRLILGIMDRLPLLLDRCIIEVDRLLVQDPRIVQDMVELTLLAVCHHRWQDLEHLHFDRQNLHHPLEQDPKGMEVLTDPQM